MKVTIRSIKQVVWCLLWLGLIMACDDANQSSNNGNMGGDQAGEMLAGEVQAGEILAGEVEAGEMLAGEVEAGEMLAGEVQAGEMLAGEVEAGEMFAGEVEAGEMIAGEVQAGEIMAGEMMGGSPIVMCEPEWLELEADLLPQTIYNRLAETYQEITPTPDLGGNLNRYTTARAFMFSQVERRNGPNEELGVYTIYTQYFTPLAPNSEPDHSEVNCEHTWPRSRLINDEDSAHYQHQQSDLHHLLPARSVVNSLRGSQYFGEPMYAVNREYRPALSGQDSDGRNVFLPIDERRGDVARVIFYMSLRWGLDIPAHEEDNLRAWHVADPVDAWEMERNQRIQDLQGNRNPFIDCPDLVALINDFTSHNYAEQEVLSLP